MAEHSAGTSAERRVILIMKQPGNARVLAQAVAEIGLVGVGVSSETELEQALQCEEPTCSALVDVSGFGKSVWRLCEMLHQCEVPFVVLSTPRDNAIGSQSLSYGAVSVLNKPVTKAALLQLMQSLYNRQEGIPHDG